MYLAFDSFHNLVDTPFNSHDPYQDDRVCFMAEVVDIALAVAQFDDVVSSTAALRRVKEFVEKKGCPQELIAVCGEELQLIGIDLNRYNTYKAKQQLHIDMEAVADKFSVENIKIALFKIIDAIMRIIAKALDFNKKDANQLKSLIQNTLVGTSKFDTEKFSDVLITAYPYKEFMYLTSVLAHVDLGAQVKGEENLHKGSSDTLKKVVETAGWKISDADKIIRSSEAAIKRGKTRELAWSIDYLPAAAKNAVVMLEHLRLNGKRFETDAKKIVDSMAKTAAGYEEAKLKLKYIGEYVKFTSTLSLILSSQIINIIKTLRVKQ